MKKKTNRGLALGAGPAMMIALGTPLSAAHADTFEVDSLGSTENPMDGVTTLREAIQQANATSVGDTITFAAELSGSIEVGEGSGLDPIRYTLLIDGDNRITLDAGGTLSNAIRAGYYNNGYYDTELTLTGLTITGASGAGVHFAFGYSGNESLTIEDSVITGNGRGIETEVAYGALVVRDTTIENNTGRGIDAGNYYADVTVENSVISGNAGAIRVSGYYSDARIQDTEITGDSGDEGTVVSISGYYGDVEITDSVIDGNTGTRATLDIDLYAYYGGTSVSVSGTTITNNAANGLAVYEASSTTISNSVITGNTQSGSSGAGEGNGGGVFLDGTSATITDSTIADNTAYYSGGGIAASESSLELNNVEISGNSANGTGGGLNFANPDTNPNEYNDFDLSVTNSVITGNSATDSNGGGIHVNDSGVEYSYGTGDITITNSVIADNDASGEGSGGGVYIDLYGGDFSSASISISGSQIEDNQASGSGAGGGVFLRTGGYTDPVVTDSVISGNSASGNGGGLFMNGSYYASLTVERSVISGNSSGADGGGIYFSYDTENSTTVALNQTTISDNTADQSGGGMMLLSPYGDAEISAESTTVSGNTASGGFGGGLHAKSTSNTATVTLVNSTVSGNSAWTGGSGVAATGVYNDFDDYGGYTVVNLTGTTVAGNTTTGDNEASAQRAQVFAGISDTASITMDHSVAWNGMSNDTDVGTQAETMSEGTSINVTYSLSGGYDPGPESVSTDPVSDDLEGMDPMLGALADNGGFTQTHLPAFGSALINGGDSTVPAALNDVDQRGSNRLFEGSPIGGDVDIGAVEIYDTNGDETLDNEPPRFADNFVSQVDGVVGDNVTVMVLDYITDPDGDTITPADVKFYGTLPAGLTYDNGTGEISGTLSAAGDFLVTASATDNISGTTAVQVTATVLAEAPPKSKKKSDDDDDDDGFLGLGGSTPAWLLALAGLLGLGRRRR